MTERRGFNSQALGWTDALHGLADGQKGGEYDTQGSRVITDLSTN